MALQEIICDFLLPSLKSCSTLGIDTLLIEYTLIPAIFLVIFVHFMTSLLKVELSKKMDALLGIAVLLGMISYGYYGIFAAFISQWFKIMLLVGLGWFILTSFIRPSWLHKATETGISLGQLKNDARILKDRIEVKRKELDKFEKWIKTGQIGLGSKNEQVIKMLMHEVDMELISLEEQLKRGNILNLADGGAESRRRMEDMYTRVYRIDTLMENLRDEMGKNYSEDDDMIEDRISESREEIRNLKKELKSRAVQKKLKEEKLLKKTEYNLKLIEKTVRNIEIRHENSKKMSGKQKNDEIIHIENLFKRVDEVINEIHTLVYS